MPTHSTYVVQLTGGTTEYIRDVTGMSIEGCFVRFSFEDGKTRWISCSHLLEMVLQEREEPRHDIAAGFAKGLAEANQPAGDDFSITQSEY